MREPPAQRALRLLAQLERQELDRARQSLRTIEVELAAMDEALAGLRERQADEHAAGWSLPGGPGLLAGYIDHARREEQRLARSTSELEAAAGRAELALRERVAGVKSLELAVEQLETVAAAEAARRLQLEIEEASLRPAAPR